MRDKIFLTRLCCSCFANAQWSLRFRSSQKGSHLRKFATIPSFCNDIFGAQTAQWLHPAHRAHAHCPWYLHPQTAKLQVAAFLPGLVGYRCGSYSPGAGDIWWWKQVLILTWSLPCVQEEVLVMVAGPQISVDVVWCLRRTGSPCPRMCYAFQKSQKEYGWQIFKTILAAHIASPEP